MIGIIGALKEEINDIIEMMTDKFETKISGVNYITGKICDKDVVVAVCGIGKVFSAVCTQTMILKFAPKLIINVGVAGSLSDDLTIGDIAIADKVVQHDIDSSPLGDPLGMISGINIVYLPCDKDAVLRFSECITDLGIHNKVGTIASGDQFLSSDEKKKAIVENFGAIACEMEGASIGHASYINSTPFIIIRAISDNANNDAHIDFPTFLNEAASNLQKIVKSYLS